MNFEVRPGEDGRMRCGFCVGKPDYEAYHDAEWGRPERDDRRLFEKLCLEGFQCGLSWYTILQRRSALREVFFDFDWERVAAMGSKEVERLMADPRLIRSRAKILATIHNAALVPALLAEFKSLAAFVWSFEPKPEERPRDFRAETVLSLTETPSSRALAKALKARGWKFFGPTTAYAFMQAMGIVNDHLEGCFLREPLEKVRLADKSPR